MKWLSWLLVVVVCIAVAAAIGFYKYSEIQASIAQGKAFPEPVESVELYVVEQILRTPSLTVTGEVVSAQSAAVRSELNGRIVFVGFAPGARVTSGQVLLRLDTSEEIAQLAEARATQKIAKLALDRSARLVKSGAGSVESRDQALAQFEGAGARVRALTALIDKKTLRAPFAALAGLHQLEPGQYLDAGDVVAELIGLTDRLWIDFSLPQEHANINVGSSVKVSSQVSPQALSATVIARAASVNVRSRNLTLRAELPSSGTLLLPGMLVNVSIVLNDTLTATVVPATAVRRDAFGSSVYVLTEVVENGEPKTRAKKRPVVISNIVDPDQSADLVVVISGLRVGEQIAALGAFKLRDGSLVQAHAANAEAQARLVGH